MSRMRSLNLALSCRMRPSTFGFTLSLLSFTLSLSRATLPATSAPNSAICFRNAPSSPCSTFFSRPCSSRTRASSSFSACTSSAGAPACSMESLFSSCSMVTRAGWTAISLCGLTTAGSLCLRSGTLMSRREAEAESGGESMLRWERVRCGCGSGERFLEKYSLMNCGECSPESWDSLRRRRLACAKGSQMTSSRERLDLLSGLLMAPTDFHILLQLSPHNSLLSLIIMSASKYAGDDELTSAVPADLYQQQPHQEHVSPDRREALQEEASNFHRCFTAFAKRPFFTEDHYYLVSSRWLRRWKQYVSYEEVLAAQEPQKFFGCGSLPILNEDIVDSTHGFTFTFEGKHSYLNVKLKAGLMENRDYEFVDAESWAVLGNYERKPVLRWVVSGKEGKKVELYLQSVSVIPLSMGILKDVENERITKLGEVSFQCSHYLTAKEVGNLVEGPIGEWARRSSYSSFPSEDFCRFWVLKETRKNVLWNTLHQGCKANASFSYKLFMDGELVNDDQEVGDLELLPETIVVAELREYRENWTFYNLTHKLEASCSYCKKTGQLGYVCSCKSAAYCSKQCKSYDKSTHRYRCPNDAESDEEEKPLALNENSRKGLAGLRNLGNTCFMNSGLQCLSHVLALTDFFLSDRYLADVNKTNKLGTQGELSAEYAKMVKNLWLGEQSSFSPTHLKKSIAKFQPMFSGYNQHDSGELITYLLDGLHEDLNRVIEKPYTETKDYDGRPDHIIAKQAWETFLMRNQSIVVDLMYGQFKSIVQCPNEQCGHVSVTFDPFSVCSLPILNTASKTLEITFIKDQVYTRKLNLAYSLEKSPTLEDLLPDLRSKVGLSSETPLLIYVGSYSSCEVVDIKEQAEKIRKEYKYRTMYVRELYPEQDPATGIKLMLGNVVNNDYYPDESYRKNIIPFHLFYTSPNSTNKQVYRQLTSYYERILRAGKLSEQEYQKAYINIQPADQTFRLLMIPTSRYYTCGYCDKKSCSGCKLPYNDELFSKYIRYNPKSEYDRDRRIEMELYWRKDAKEVEKVFEEIKQEESSTFPTQAKSANTSIYDCLNLFEREEVLNEQNAWYCPKCQDFVLARKQMKIYKAPKILILCLKRFKRRDYYSEKINLLIDCPVNGLDLTSCVANPQLPEEYFAPTRTVQEGEEDKVLYDLIGISNHFGSTGGGHYTAYCKDPNSQEWYDFDDSSVNKLRGEEDVVTESAYILFYQRRM